MLQRRLPVIDVKVTFFLSVHDAQRKARNPLLLPIPFLPRKCPISTNGVKLSRLSREWNRAEGLLDLRLFLALCLIYSNRIPFSILAAYWPLLSRRQALPTHQAYAPQPCLRLVVKAWLICLALFTTFYNTILDDPSWPNPATVHALDAHRLRVKPYSSRSASIALLAARCLLRLQSPSKYCIRGSAGQEYHPENQNGLHPPIFF
jgi:hypothetical protein